MYSVVQCRRCWIWYETRQSGIWGEASAGFAFIVKRRARVSRSVRGRTRGGYGFGSLTVLCSGWHHTRKSQMEQQKCFHLAALKSHITASGYLWKLMTVAQSLSSNAHFFFFHFVPFCGSVPVASFKSPASLFERVI